MMGEVRQDKKGEESGKKRAKVKSINTSFLVF